MGRAAEGSWSDAWGLERVLNLPQEPQHQQRGDYHGPALLALISGQLGSPAQEAQRFLTSTGPPSD